MSKCIKPFTLRVNAGLSPFLWWPMEEPGENDRIDTVRSEHFFQIFLSGATTAADVGIVALGMEFNAPNLSNGFADQWSATPAPPATWKGIEFDFWARWDLWSDIFPLSVQWYLAHVSLNYAGIQNFDLLFYYFQGSLIITLTDSVGGLFDTFSVPFTPVAGVWYFLSAFHDPSTGTFGFYINNGAAHSQPTVSAPVGSMDSLTLGIEFNNGNPNPTTPQTKTRLDEYAVFLSRNTPAQRSAIYNGGSGRTWP